MPYEESGKKLVNGLKIITEHPEVAFRSCESCRKYIYDDKGEITLWRGEKALRNGAKVPCDTAKGCPKGHYDDPVELSQQNQRFYAYHSEVKILGGVPENERFRWVTRRLGLVEDMKESMKQTGAMSLAQALLGG